MKNALALTLVLGVALPAAALAQESTQKPVATHETGAPKAPAKVGGQNHKQTSGKTRSKAAQVPNQVSAGNPTAAAQKRDARIADGPASNDETTENVSKKPAVKKKKASDTQVDDKAKPQS